MRSLLGKNYYHNYCVFLREPERTCCFIYGRRFLFKPIVYSAVPRPRALSMLRGEIVFPNYQAYLNPRSWITAETGTAVPVHGTIPERSARRGQMKRKLSPGSVFFAISGDLRS